MLLSHSVVVYSEYYQYDSEYLTPNILQSSA